ncbi:MAG: radical SAM protein [Candidatus Bathyarchaeota archaeon]|nr:MAG: radical SAM protein [Candidatus Bathyarchaeota archaeon]
METESICPECFQVIPATIHEEDGKVYITKTCQEHGEFSEIYWGDYEEFQRAQRYERFGRKLDNPRTKVDKGCPHDCGICTEHKSSTVLGIIDVTNSCNLRCPICFAHAGAAGYLYEPTKEQIRGMMENLLSNSPVWTPALQLSGGEPTVREDLPELVEMAFDLGFVHVEINTNGIKMAENVEYCRTLKEAGVSTVYLQFDGVTPEPYIAARGFDLLDIKKRAIENLREADYRSIVLVPVLVKGVNDDQVGDIIRFAIENKDVIRCINFQPVSITGRINRREREGMRITIPDLMRLVEEQTDGLIEKRDWYPVPAAQPLCNFLSVAKNEPFVDFSAHPHCGMATYLFIDGDQVTPIPDYMDVDKTLETFEKASERMAEGKERRAKMQLVMGLIKNVKFKALSNYMKSVVLHSDYLSLNRMHHSMILISSMHFMDPYNFDLDRVQRCVIHYATPDGRIIPFCTMNTLHREEMERKFAQPITEANVTPLYDVFSLTQRIREEGRDEKSAQKEVEPFQALRARHDF